MKLNYTTITVFGIIFLLSVCISCNKKGYVGGRIENSLTETPIGGIEVGLYKFSLANNYAQWSDIKLIALAQSDSLGRFGFTVDEDLSLGSCIFALTKTTDTLSLNYQYRHKWDYFTKAGEPVLSLLPSITAILQIPEDKNQESIIMEYKNQYSGYNTQQNGFQLMLEPGKTHDIAIYKTVDNTDSLITVKQIYVPCRRQISDTVLLPASIQIIQTGDF